MTRYEEMLSYYVGYIKRISNEYYKKNLSSLTPCDFQVNKGRKYDKVVKVENGVVGSVHSFVEKSTGKVWKAASFKAPALNFHRANIYNYNSLVKAVHIHGIG